MDDAEFDRLIARASNPALIAGIYNYCDGRCHRCRFTGRCLTFLERQDEAGTEGVAEAAGGPLATTIGRSLDRTLGMIQIIATREGIDLSAIPGDGESDRVVPRSLADPLVVRSREYARITWPIVAAIEPIVAAKRDRAVIEAVDTIQWLCTMVPAKIYRAVTGSLFPDYDPADLQSDPNGSAKVARLQIDDSRRAWRVLMQAGKATANGVPSTLVRMLDELDAALAERFPQAMKFVRPGFDEGS